MAMMFQELGFDTEEAFDGFVDWCYDELNYPPSDMSMADLKLAVADYKKSN